MKLNAFAKILQIFTSLYILSQMRIVEITFQDSSYANLLRFSSKIQEEKDNSRRRGRESRYNFNSVTREMAD